MNIENRTIFERDNLDILRGIDTDSIDLIYLDPPFNSNRNYEAPIGSEAAGAAFKDSWTMNDVKKEWHGELAENRPELYHAIAGAELTHSKSMKAYLIMMAVRMLEMKRILKSTGSIYLHCDPTASHYLKTMMDSIFGADNFRNEIVWQRVSTIKGNLTRGLARDSDIILRYSDGSDFVWNADAVTIPYDMNNLDEKTKKQYRLEKETGRLVSYTSLTAPIQDPDSNLTYEVMGIVRTWRWNKERMHKEIELGNVIQTAPGNVPRFKRYLDEQKGKKINNIWIDIPNVHSKSNERCGYPTQKPLALLERIIKSSSNQGDLVLDPFCGCATTCVAAEKLGRQWVGIDISEKAIELVRIRLENEVGMFGPVHHRKDVPKRSDATEAYQLQEPSLLYGLTTKIDLAKSDVESGSYRSHKHMLYGIQEGKCNACQVHLPFRNMTVDHILARSKGGTDEPDNLQLLCGACNSVKGSKTQEELISRLKQERVI